MRSGLTEKWLVCRICLRQPQEGMASIFDSRSDRDLTKMILECGGVPIKQFDHYPDKICLRCNKQLRIAHKFRTTCQRSHKHLCKLIAPVDVETSVNETATTTTTAETEDENSADSDQVTAPSTCDITEGATTPTINTLSNDIAEEYHTEESHFKLESGEGEEMNDEEQEHEQDQEQDQDQDQEQDPDQDQEDELDIKKEISDLDDDGEIADIFEPIEMDEDVEIFEEIDEENIERTNSGLSDEIEYLEDIIGEELTSDEEFLPEREEKLAHQKKTRQSKTMNKKQQGSGKARGRPKGSRNMNTNTSVQKTTNKQPEKRGRKPKYPNITLYICDMCGNTYPTQGRLTEHIKLHYGIKPHECEICGHAFAQTQQLARHMNTHTGNRPYKCNYCPAAFADLSTRNKHHRIHTQERPYVCDVCGKAFSYTNTLKFHKMIHTGEKPFVCDICGKGFQQAYKLRNHKVTHAKRGIVKPEKVEVDTLVSFQEVHEATAQILEI